VKWSFLPQGALMGNPQWTTAGVYVASWLDNLGAYEGTVYVQRIDYTTGLEAGIFELAKIKYGLGDIPPVPPATFSVNGQRVYFPFQTQAGISNVIACATNANGCTGSNLIWQSGALQGDVTTTLPYAQHSVLAAVAGQFTWFLDANTGAVLNNQGKPYSPSGAMVTMAVQPGMGRDFYLLNGSGVPGTLPVEVVAIDDPAVGEVFRYSINGSSIMAGVAEDGQVWLRAGPDLLRPMPLPEYRLVRN
jgi:hypothetical protein